MTDSVINKVLFFISGIGTTILLTNMNSKVVYPPIIISAIIQFVLIFKLDLTNRFKIENKIGVVPYIVSLLGVLGYLMVFLWLSKTNNLIIPIVITIISYPLICKVHTLILNTIYSYKNDILKYKKTYLYYSIWAIIICILGIYIFGKTSGFHYPVSIDGIRENNTIFGSDIASFSGNNNHLFTGDHLRHPALTVILMPLLMAVYLVSLIASSIFNLELWVLFSLVYAMLQAFIYSLIATIIYSLLKKYISDKLSFVGGFLYLSTFPTILYSTMVERFGFEILLLLLFVVTVIENKKEEHQNFLFALSSFSVISSAAIYPIKFLNNKINIDIIKKTIKLGVCMVASLFLMGRGSILFLLDNNMKHNMVYFVGSIFDNRILQYLSFQSGIFTSPNWIILYKSSFNFEFPAHQYGEFADGIIMQAYPQEVFYYIIGATIALMTIIAFIVNRKSILAKISFYWFVFGFFLLGVLGLGSTYNEMALYLSYFSWAQIILIIMLVNKAVKSERFKYIIIFLSSILLFAYNVNTLLIMSNLLGVNYPPLW